MRLPAAGYKQRMTVIRSGDEQAHEVMPRVHNVAALLKRWVLGTLQGGVHISISIITSMSSRFASTVAAQAPAIYFFTALPSRPLPFVRHPTVPLFTHIVTIIYAEAVGRRRFLIMVL